MTSIIRKSCRSCKKSNKSKFCKKCKRSSTLRNSTVIHHHYHSRKPIRRSSYKRKTPSYRRKTPSYHYLNQLIKNNEFETRNKGLRFLGNSSEDHILRGNHTEVGPINKNGFFGGYCKQSRKSRKSRR